MVDLSAPDRRVTPSVAADGDPVILAFHGTRHPGGEPVAHQIAARVSSALDGADVRVGWVDVHPDVLADTLPDVGDATVVPCFLAAGYHVRHDVPGAVAASPHRVRVTDHIGPRALDGVVERIAQAGGPGQGVVLAVIGSRYPEATAEVAAAAATLALLLGVPVRVGTIFSGEPTVAEAVAGLRAEGVDDLVIAPYAIAPGLFAARLDGHGARVASPIGTHPSLISAIAGLVRHSAPSGV